VTRLDDLAGVTAGLDGPALLMVGEAMALANADIAALASTLNHRLEGASR
jgi:hypothetical protein